jgi:hypothetical protein
VRRLLPAALVVSLVLAGALLLAPAAPALLSSCTPPKVSGVDVTTLRENGIGCDRARSLLADVIRHDIPAKWSCSERVSGRSVNALCHVILRPTDHFSATWFVH